ncbi:MAG: hypothetical protein ACXITV_02435 [Luteibaculaceae bacterium]
MKKLLFLSAIAVTVLATSCNREKECECALISDNPITGPTTSVFTQTTKESCNDFNMTDVQNVPGFGTVSTTTFCRQK